jgi:hypothetical protein
MDNSCAKCTSSLFDINEPNILNILDEPLYSFDQNYFIAGNRHKYLSQWRTLLDRQGSRDIIQWVENGVDINDFVQHVKGEFWVIQYDNDFPPSRHFQNAKHCEQFVHFINSELEER